MFFTLTVIFVDYLFIESIFIANCNLQILHDSHNIDFKPGIAAVWGFDCSALYGGKYQSTNTILKVQDDKSFYGLYYAGSHPISEAAEETPAVGSSYVKINVTLRKTLTKYYRYKNTQNMRIIL